MHGSSRSALAGLLLSFGVVAPASAQAATPCQGWSVHTVASGLGILESVLDDGAGGVLLPTGDAFVTRDLGSGTGITRIHAGTVTTSWAALDDTNGIAIDEARGLMWTVQTFTPNAPIQQISLADPTTVTQVGDLAAVGSPVPEGLDGLIRIGDDLFIAANLSGEVLRFDAVTHQACLLASGLMDPSSVAVGTGHGFRAGSLFAAGFDGTVRELDPPPAATTSPPPSATAASPSPRRPAAGRSGRLPRGDRGPRGAASRGKVGTYLY